MPELFHNRIKHNGNIITELLSIIYRINLYYLTEIEIIKINEMWNIPIFNVVAMWKSDFLRNRRQLGILFNFEVFQLSSNHPESVSS